MPPALSLAIGFLGPASIFLFGKFIGLAESPRNTLLHFLTGAILAFVALIVEQYVFQLFGPLIAFQWRRLVEAFIFVALVEEVVKIAQISELSRRHSATRQQTIAIGLAVAAGFAGAENVVYLFRYSNDVAQLLLIRTLTANPMHLAVGVIASNFIFEGLQDEEKSYYLALAIIVATFFHGLYDFSIINSAGHSSSSIYILVFVVLWAYRIQRRLR